MGFGVRLAHYKPLLHIELCIELVCWEHLPLREVFYILFYLILFYFIRKSVR
jgi:hypothetical protein